MSRLSSTPNRNPRWRSSRRLGLLAGVAALCGTPLVATSAASAAVSASSPGNIAVSVSTPGPVLSGVASTYTVTATNNTPTDFSFTSIGGQLSTNMTLGGFGVADDCARSNSNAFGVVRGPGFSCIWAAPVAGAPATILTLAPGETASWTFSATATSAGISTAHITAQGSFASPTALGNGVSNAVDLSIPVSQGPGGGGGGGGGGAIPGARSTRTGPPIHWATPPPIIWGRCWISSIILCWMIRTPSAPRRL